MLTSLSRNETLSPRYGNKSTYLADKKKIDPSCLKKNMMSILAAFAYRPMFLATWYSKCRFDFVK